MTSEFIAYSLWARYELFRFPDLGIELQYRYFGTVTKPVGQLKFNGFKVVGDIFLKVQVTDDPPR